MQVAEIKRSEEEEKAEKRAEEEEAKKKKTPATLNDSEADGDKTEAKAPIEATLPAKSSAESEARAPLMTIART